jgi:hypothetical protein
MFKSPSELTVCKVGEVEEVPGGGEEEEVPDNARGGFEVWRGKVSLRTSRSWRWREDVHMSSSFDSDLSESRYCLRTYSYCCMDVRMV